MTSIKDFSRLKSICCILFAMVLAAGCKIGQVSSDFKVIKRDAQQISTDIKAVRAAVVPMDSMMMDVTSGLLSELSHANSEEKLDSIAARINRILVTYLNESFRKLDPGPTGENLMRGTMRPLLDKETEQRLQEMIRAVSQQAGEDFAVTIRGMMTELTSAQSKAKLNSLVLSLLSSSNSDSLSSFINHSVRKVDFEDIGRRIATELIEANVKPQVDSVVRMAVRSIFDEIKKDQTARGFFDDIRNIMLLGLGIVGVIMALLFWYNRKKAMDMNRMFVNAIEELEGKHADDAKRAVERQARAQGLLRHVDKILKKENLHGRKNPGQNNP